MISRLYKFTQGSTEWTFTSGDSDVVYGGDTYTTKPMACTGVPLGGDGKIKASFAADDTFASGLVSTAEDSIVSLLITNYDGTTFTSGYNGRLVRVELPTDKTVLIFETDYSRTRITGARRPEQRTCPHGIYSADCGLDKANFEIATTITDIDGYAFEIFDAGTYDDHWFTYGLLIDGNGTYHYIQTHVGTTVIVKRVSALILSEFQATGTSDVSIYPGCLKDVFVCDSKFSNSVNFGGFPWMPLEGVNKFKGVAGTPEIDIDRYGY